MIQRRTEKQSDLPISLISETHSATSAMRQADGGIAQLGERLHGMQEVSGSIPLTSTNTKVALFKRCEGFSPLRLEA